MSDIKRTLVKSSTALFILITFTATQFIYGQTNDEKLATANKALNEAIALRKKGGVESLNAAREKIHEAISLFQASGDQSGNAGSFNMLGEISSELGENQKALEYYNQALPVLRKIGDKEHEAMVLVGIALTYNTLGEKRKAIDYYQQALPLFQSIKNSEDEANGLIIIGDWLNDLGETQKSLNSYEMALMIYHSLNNKPQEANVLTGMGQRFDTFGEKQKALNHYKQAQLIYQSLGDKSGEAYMLLGLGVYYASIGEFQKSLEYNNQALLLHRFLGDKENEAVAFLGIGSIYSNSGEYEKALENYDKALLLVRSLNENKGKLGEATIVNLMGNVYSALGENQKALESFKEAIEIFSIIGNKKGEATILNNIGLSYSNLGENEKAIIYYSKALEASQNIGDKQLQATALNNIGNTYLLNKPKVSLNYYIQSLQIFRAIQDKHSEALANLNIGIVYFSLKENEKALENLNQALILSRAISNKSGEANALAYIAGLWNERRNPRFTVFYGKQAVNAFQQIRANIKGLDKETQKTYLKTLEPAYRRFADVLITNNRLAEAQQILNLFKDQQFFDFNSNKQTAPLVLTEREAMNISLFNKKLERIGIIFRQIDESRRSIGSRESTTAEKNELKQLEIDLQKANDDYMAFLKQAEKEFAAPPDEKDKVPPVADLQQMQTALRELSVSTKQKTIAVYTLVGEENYRALIITADSIFSVSTSIKGEALNQKAQQLWRLLRTPDYDPQPLAKEIYDVVFAQIAAKMPAGTKTILWSLDGNLRYIPVSALHDGMQYLVERFDNIVFTRADKERIVRNVSVNSNGTGFGSSESHTVQLAGDSFNASALPSVKAELSRIFKNGNSTTGVLHGEILLDKRFSKAAMLSELQKRRPIVHIASHFKFEAGDEARSFLLLGDGTTFTLNEMKREQNLFEGVDLLTLSACQTAAQRADATGREVDGFAELAQRLGAGAVVASLWEVADDSTAELMARFYRAYKSPAGVNKAQALRSAQLALLSGAYKTSSAIKRELIRENASATAKIKIDSANLKPFKVDKNAPFAHPFYWSPFILIGNWK